MFNKVAVLKCRRILAVIQPPNMFTYTTIFRKIFQRRPHLNQNKVTFGVDNNQIKAEWSRPILLELMIHFPTEFDYILM